MEIPISKIKIDKNQPRKTFDKDSLKHLAESILSNGLITPIDVDENYMLIDGERRFKAHQIAGLKKIECRIVKINKDEVKRLKRQLIADIQDEEIPTGERYEAIVRLYKMEKGLGHSYNEFIKELGISKGLLNSALDYCDFSEKEPELVKSVSPHIIAETKSLPKEEREEIIEQFKDTKDKKKDLIRELVKQKKEEIKTKKELEEQRKNKSNKEIKITTDRERLWQIRDEIFETQRHFDKLMANVRWVRKTKFYLNKPKDRDNFIRFLDGASERARKWANELDELKENIWMEVVKE